MLVLRAEGRRSLRRTGGRLEKNTKMNFKNGH
jgi:hypothetical protein